MLKFMIGLCAVLSLSGFGFIEIHKGPEIGIETASKIEPGHSISGVETAIGRPGALISIEGEKHNETRVFLWESETDSLKVAIRHDRVVQKVYRGRAARIASDAKAFSTEEGLAPTAGANHGPFSEGERVRNDAMASKAASMKRIRR